jgi:hypothetical protein
MMNEGGRGQLAGHLADLAQRVGDEEAIPDTLPCRPIPLLAGRITLVLVVPSHVLFGMGIAEPIVRQLRATGETAWALGFVRHGYPSKTKAPGTKKHRRRLSKMNGYAVIHDNSVSAKTENIYAIFLTLDGVPRRMADSGGLHT